MTLRTASRIAIGVQFAALVRCLAEYFRLKYILGRDFSPARFEPFVIGALVTSLFVLGAVLAYFVEKHKLAVALATINVVVLLVLRFLLL